MPATGQLAMKRVAVYFKNVYGKHLLLSNTVTTMALLGVGDVLSQWVDNKCKSVGGFKKEMMQISLMENRVAFMARNSAATVDATTSKFTWDKIDWFRTVKVCCVGLFTGPLGHFWYEYLDSKYPSRSRVSVVKKVFLDHAIASPILNLLFIVVTHTLDGKYLTETWQVIKEKFFKIYVYDSAIWPATQLFNFFYVSNAYRLLYVNLTSVFLNAVLSYLLFDDEHQHNASVASSSESSLQIDEN